MRVGSGRCKLVRDTGVLDVQGEERKNSSARQSFLLISLGAIPDTLGDKETEKRDGDNSFIYLFFPHCGFEKQKQFTSTGSLTAIQEVAEMQDSLFNLIVFAGVASKCHIFTSPLHGLRRQRH